MSKEGEVISKKLAAIELRKKLIVNRVFYIGCIGFFLMGGVASGWWKTTISALGVGMSAVFFYLDQRRIVYLNNRYDLELNKLDKFIKGLKEADE